jgi:hypothetical protein
MGYVVFASLTDIGGDIGRKTLLAEQDHCGFPDRNIGF